MWYIQVIIIHRFGKILLASKNNKLIGLWIEEQKYYREENMRKYVPIENVEIREGEMGIIEVKNYIFLNFGSYSEY